MFTWICPKCGKEVPPSYDECPNCAPTAESRPPAQPAESAPAPPPPQAPVAAAPPPPPPVAPAAPRKAGVPPWAMTLLLAVAFVAILAGLYTVLRTKPKESAQAAPPAADATVRLPTEAAFKAHPVIKNIEVTGLRLSEDAKQKAHLDFVVVNHSPAEIAGLTANAKLIAVNAQPGDAPLATFSFKTDLGPWEAKDMKVPANTKLRPYELPDWQFVRADIEVTAP